MLFTMAHADKHRILHPLQHGFRKCLSCDIQLVEFVDDIARNIDRGKQTDCLIMDFSKAFDKVCLSLLVHKLHHYGIRDKTNRWIQSFLRDRNQSVVVEGETSNSIPVESGISVRPQLVPILHQRHARKYKIQNQIVR